MPEVRIYKPAKTAMQSGVGRTREWVLEFIQPTHIYIEPLMKWMGSFNSNSVHPKIFFETCEKAIEYANSKNLTYFIDYSPPFKIIPKRYSDNFTNPKKR